jgi:hypothetical protein
LGEVDALWNRLCKISEEMTNLKILLKEDNHFERYPFAAKKILENLRSLLIPFGGSKYVRKRLQDKRDLVLLDLFLTDFADKAKIMRKGDEALSLTAFNDIFLRAKALQDYGEATEKVVKVFEEMLREACEKHKQAMRIII